MSAPDTSIGVGGHAGREQIVDTALLVSWPLPDPADAADKDERGRILIIGGSAELPGAVILAALAAMRAGAGKLCVATAASVAAVVAAALPEARVISLDENAKGGLRITANTDLPADIDAVLIGPGLQDEEATVELTKRTLDRYELATFVLDAFAMTAVTQGDIDPGRQPLIVTPHPGEMAHLTGRTKETICASLRDVAVEMAAQWRVVVAMKSATTFVTSVQGDVWRHESGSCGLAISGSGDVLAGIITGLAARGANAEQATVWGVALHARSGKALEGRFGPIGYLARELPQEIPALMAALASSNSLSPST